MAEPTVPPDLTRARELDPLFDQRCQVLAAVRALGDLRFEIANRLHHSDSNSIYCQMATTGEADLSLLAQSMGTARYLDLSAFVARRMFELLVSVKYVLSDASHVKDWYQWAAGDLRDIVVGTGKKGRHVEKWDESVLTTVQNMQRAMAEGGAVIDRQPNLTTLSELVGEAGERESLYAVYSKFCHITALGINHEAMDKWAQILPRLFRIRSIRYAEAIYCHLSLETGLNPAHLDCRMVLVDLSSDTSSTPVTSNLDP